MTRAFLDISTLHLPRAIFEGIAIGEIPVTNLLQGDYGVAIHVPGSGEEHPETPSEVIAIYAEARRCACDYVMLDGDGDVIRTLPTYPKSWA